MTFFPALSLLATNPSDATEGCKRQHYFFHRQSRKLRQLCIASCDTALQRACDNKDAKEIRREVDRIREAGLTKYLQNETREAMYLVELLERMPANKNVLDMGRKLMTEIRRYQNPPPAMHRIMQSALLLLGEDEDTTDVRINVTSYTSLYILLTYW